MFFWEARGLCQTYFCINFYDTSYFKSIKETALVIFVQTYFIYYIPGCWCSNQSLFCCHFDWTHSPDGNIFGSVSPFKVSKKVPHGLFSFVNGRLNVGIRYLKTSKVEYEKLRKQFLFSCFTHSTK